MIGAFVQVNGGKHYLSVRYPIGYVVQESGCWEWVGNRDPKGYGKLRHEGVKVLAHRFVYECERGPIPQGLELDHLCRNRVCVRPDHLEPVTDAVNILRGNGSPALNKRKTHCKRGHELVGANLRVWADGGRRCYECWITKHRSRRRVLRDNSA